MPECPMKEVKKIKRNFWFEIPKKDGDLNEI